MAALQPAKWGQLDLKGALETFGTRSLFKRPEENFVPAWDTYFDMPKERKEIAPLI